MKNVFKVSITGMATGKPIIAVESLDPLGASKYRTYGPVGQKDIQAFVKKSLDEAQAFHEQHRADDQKEWEMMNHSELVE